MSSRLMPIDSCKTQPPAGISPVKYKSRDDSGRIPIFPFVPFFFFVVDQ